MERYVITAVDKKCVIDSEFIWVPSGDDPHGMELGRETTYRNIIIHADLSLEAIDKMEIVKFYADIIPTLKKFGAENIEVVELVDAVSEHTYKYGEHVEDPDLTEEESDLLDFMLEHPTYTTSIAIESKLNIEELI